ncbi:hypothetical protein EYF80_016277 [Liparis tanakae]|uniref:Uncharacterized protein n=1 Tax=Liparis tanakae TaxID=230148 RepID=A0A4Z2I625_9TELE|nr:hypothetical protein EYF80_016277 [Liparis tanakae]
MFTAYRKQQRFLWAVSLLPVRDPRDQDIEAQQRRCSEKAITCGPTKSARGGFGASSVLQMEGPLINTLPWFGLPPEM